MNIIVSIIGILLILAIAGVTYMLMIAEGEEQKQELVLVKTKDYRHDSPFKYVFS